MPTLTILKIDPAGTYLADKAGSGNPVQGADTNAKNPTEVQLSTLNAAAGSVIALTAQGAWQAGSGTNTKTGLPFTDSNNALLAVFVDEAGNAIAPASLLGYATPAQSSGKTTDISQDFFVVSSAVTQVQVPANAVALRFSVSDTFFGDNVDPNSDFKVQIQLVDATTSYAGNDLLMGTPADETIAGGAGNDTLSGGSGNDVLRGELGSDVFWGGAGNDTLMGGEQRHQGWLVSTFDDFDRIETSSSSSGIAVNLSSRTVVVDGGTDVYSGMEEIDGTLNKADTVTGRTSDSATAGDGMAINLYLRGGSDTVDITGYGKQQPWADGARVYYHWSQTGISVSYSDNGRTASVAYGSTTGTNAQTAGTDTLTNVGLLGDTAFNDTFNLSKLKYNQLGYITDSRLGASYNTLLLGRGGSDTVTGNGLTNVHFNAVTTSSTGAGITINLKTTTAQSQSHLSSSGVVLNSITLVSGVRGVIGTKFPDTLVGGVAANDKFETFRGDGGNDFIDGDSGYDRSDYRWSTEGVTINLAQGVVSSASQGTDTLRNIEEIRGSMYDDVFDASGFVGGTPSTTSNVSSYWWGLNAFIPEGGNDKIIGNGSTRIDYSNAMIAVLVNLATGVADAKNEGDKSTDGYKTVGRDTFTGVSDVRGSAFDDQLLGGGVGRTSTGLPIEVFAGNAGNDTIDGKDGWDMAVYGSSPEGINIDLTLATGQVQDGWGFTDTVANIEEFSGSYNNDSFKGNDQNQTFHGLKGADTVDGGGGYDEVGFSGDDAGVEVKLAGWVGTSGSLPTGYTGSSKDGWGNTDVFKNIEGVEGSPYADKITGDANDNRLDGRGGADTIDGGDGNDWVEYNQAMIGVSVDLGQGKALDDGQGVGDALQSTAVEQDTLSNIENVLGGYGNDTIVGSSAANELDGGEGSDILEGAGGNDILTGGLGTDTARFTGPRGDYTVVADTSGVVTVTDKTVGRDGTDKLYGVEWLKFSDGTIAAPAPDLTAPTVVAFRPTNGATGVAVSSNIELTFSEPIVLGTGNIEIHSGSSTGPLVETFATTSPQLTVTGNQLSIDPTSSLSKSTQYFVVLTSGAVKDVSGNAFTAADEYSFTTVPPSLAGFDLSSSSITLKFDAPLSGAVLSGIKISKVSVAVDGTVGSYVDYDITKLDYTVSGSDVVITGNTAQPLNINVGSDLIALTSLDLSSQYVQDNTAAANRSAPVFDAVGKAIVISGTGNTTVDVAGVRELETKMTGPVAVFDLSGNDNLLGDALPNWLDGGSGNDIMVGDAGTDSMVGGDGDDVIFGGSESDTILSGAGNDSINAESGDDRIRYYTQSDLVGDTIDGGASQDKDRLQVFNDATSGAGTKTYDLTANSNIRNIDLVQVGTQNNAQSVKVVLSSGLTNTADLTQDGTFGDVGFTAFDGTSRDAYGRSNPAVVNIEVDGSQLTSTQRLYVRGQDGSNSVEKQFTTSGTANMNWAGGMQGNDTIKGGAGADDLIGGLGNDSILGGDGNDLLKGSEGNDTLMGGAGSNDVAVYEGRADDHRVTFRTDTYTEQGGAQVSVKYALVQNLLDGSVDKLNGIEAVQFKNGAYTQTITIGDLNQVQVNDAQLTASGLTITSNVELDRSAIDVSGLSLGKITGHTSSSAGAYTPYTTPAATGSGNEVVLSLGNNAFNLANKDLLLIGSLDTSHQKLVESGNPTNVREGLIDSGNAVVFAGEGDNTIDLALIRSMPAASKFANLGIFDLGGGNDTLKGDVGANMIDGGAGNDTVTGGDGADDILGGLGEDYIAGGAGADKIDGGSGNDRIQYFSQAEIDGDEVDGGNATDRDRVLVYTSATTTTPVAYDLSKATFWNIDLVGVVARVAGQKVTLNLSSDMATTANNNNDEYSGDIGVYGTTPTADGNQPITNDVEVNAAMFTSSQRLIVRGLDGSNFDTAAGGMRGNDVLVGGAGSDSIDAGKGNDSLVGNAGADKLVGNDGNDTLQGGSGNDTLDGGAGADLVQGDGGEDRIRYFSVAQIEGDTIDGGDVVNAKVRDRLQLFPESGAGEKLFDLSKASISNIDIVHLFSQADNTKVSVKLTADMMGTADGNNDGTAGDLILVGMDSKLLDPEGRSLYTTIAMSVDGSALTSGQRLFVYGQDGNGQSSPYNADGTINLSWAGGMRGPDVLTGGAGNDDLNAGKGNDTLIGGAGNDRLKGDEGTDSLIGGDGTDTAIYDGRQVDYLVSPAGSGTYTVKHVSSNTTDTLTGIEKLEFRDGSNVSTVDLSQAAMSLDILEAKIDSTGLKLTASKPLASADMSGISIGKVSAGVYTELMAQTLASVVNGNQVHVNLTGLFNPATDLLVLKSLNTTGQKIVATDGSLIDDSYMVGKAGNAVVLASSANVAVTVDEILALMNGSTRLLSPDAYVSLSDWQGGNNLFTGDAKANWFEGGDGNDTLKGMAGDDGLEGGRGNDVLIGAEGNDELSGGSGDDRFQYFSPAELTGDKIQGGEAGDRDGLQLSSANDNSPVTYTLSSAGSISNIDFVMPVVAGQMGTGPQANTPVVADKKGTVTVVIDSRTASTADFNKNGVFGDVGVLASDTNKLPIATDTVIDARALQSGQSITVNGMDGSTVVPAVGGMQGNDTIYGGPSTDYIDTGAGHDSIDGGAGNDYLTGRAGNDTLAGGDGEDRYRYYNASELDGDVVYGASATSAGVSSDRDVLQLYSDSQTGDKKVYDLDARSATFKDIDGVTLVTQNETQTLEVKLSPKHAQTSDQNRDGVTGDVVVYGFSAVRDEFGRQLPTKAPVIVDATLLTASGQRVSVDGRDGLSGGSSVNADGTPNMNWVGGFQGNDTLYGGAGNDWFSTGQGNDSILAGGGDDWMSGDQGNDTLDGGAGNDTANYEGLVEDFVIVKGANSTTVTQTSTGYTDTLIDVEALNIKNPATGNWTWMPLSVRFTATTQANANNNFNGTPSADNIDTWTATGYPTTAGFDRDWVWADAGNDSVRSGSGDDWLGGAAGNDTLIAGEGNDNLNGDDGDDSLEGGAGNDGLNGGAGNDVLLAGDGQDWLNGNEGNDKLFGGAGGDWLRGNEGDDAINGADSGAVKASADRLLLSNAQKTWESDDRAAYSGYAKNYTVTAYVKAGSEAGVPTGIQTGQTYFTVKDNRSSSPEGTDYVWNVDALQFQDKEVRLTPGLWFNIDYGPTPPDNNTPFTPTLSQVRGVNFNGTPFAEKQGLTDSEIASIQAANTTAPVKTYDMGGSDYLAGGAGNDTLYGGTGGDTLRGDKGDDALFGGFDRTSDSAMSWEPNGSNGFDVAEYSGASTRYTITFKNASGNNVAQFDAAGSVVVADTLVSGDGTDTLKDIEVLRFTDGEKKLSVLEYDDKYFDQQTQQTVYRGKRIDGTDWADTITGSSPSTLTGSQGEDNINAGAGNDTISSAGGNDNIHAGDGNDSISAGDGRDWIEADPGNDSIDGGNDGVDPYGNGGDQVSFDAPRTRFKIEKLTSDAGGYQWLITDKLSADLGGLGVDKLKNVENLSFNDGWYQLVPNYNYSVADKWANVNGTGFADIVNGGNHPVFLAAPNFSNDMWYWLGDGNDAALGSPIGDRFRDGSGNDIYEGGSGNGQWGDQVDFSGLQSRYTIDVVPYATFKATAEYGALDSTSKTALDTAYTGKEVVRVTDKLLDVEGGEGVNYLLGIERMNFSDSGLETGVNFNAASDQNQNNHINGGMLADTINTTDLATAWKNAVAGRQIVSTRDWINAGGGNDTISTGAGVDDITAGPGDDVIDGGDHNTPPSSTDLWGSYDGASFSGPVSRYQITFTKPFVTGDTGTRYGETGLQQTDGGFVDSLYYDPSGLVFVNDTKANGDGRDVLKNVEKLNFNDRGILLVPEKYTNTNSDSVYVNIYGSPLADRILGSDVATHISIDGRGGNDLLTGSSGFVETQKLTLSPVAGKTYKLAFGGTQLTTAALSSASISDLALKLQAATGYGDAPFTVAAGANADAGSLVLTWKAIGRQWSNATLSEIETANTTGATFTATTTPGYDGTDNLRGGPGNDSLDGGAGSDTASFSGTAKEYTINRVSDTVFTVSHNLLDSYGGDGTDTLTNVERVWFDSSSAGYRLQYQKELNGDWWNITGSEIFGDTIPAPSGSQQTNFDTKGGNDSIAFSAGGGVARLGFGDDTVIGAQVNDTGRSDSVVYNDSVDRYEISLTLANGSVTFNKSQTGWGNNYTNYSVSVQDTVAPANGGEGVDTLRYIERIDFKDGTLDVISGVFTSNNITSQDTIQKDNSYYAMDGGSDTLLGANRNDYQGYRDYVSYNDAPRERFIVSAEQTAKDDAKGTITGIAGADYKYRTVTDIASLINKTKTAGNFDTAASNISKSIGYGQDVIVGIEELNFDGGRIRLAPVQNHYTNSQTVKVNNVDQTVEVTETWNQDTDFADVMRGTAFGDNFQAGFGDDTIDGGADGTVGNNWSRVDRVNYLGTIQRYDIEPVFVKITGTGTGNTSAYEVVDRSRSQETGVVAAVRVKDKLLAVEGGLGNDLLVNVEKINFTDANFSITPDVWTNPNDGSQYITGTQFDDVITGNSKNDGMNGKEGNDLLLGMAGPDYLEGGVGNDTIDGGTNPVDNNGNPQADTARFTGPWQRFTITPVKVNSSYEVGTGGDYPIAAYRVTDTLSATDPAYLGVDLLVGIEGLSFDNRWTQLGVSRSRWLNGDGVTYNYSSNGSPFDDVIGSATLVGGAWNDTTDPSVNDNMNGQEGNDVLLGGGGGDNLRGGVGQDVIDGGARGTSGNSWQDQNVAEFSGKQDRYTVSKFAVDSTGQKISVAGTEVSTAVAATITWNGAGNALSAEAREVMELARKNSKLVADSTGYLVADTLSADKGGDGTDLVFNVDRFRFNGTDQELRIQGNKNDWMGGANGGPDGVPDGVNVWATSGNDEVTMAVVAEATGVPATATAPAVSLEKLRIDLDLRQGDDTVIGGNGGESVRPGQGNDYMNLGGNTATDNWGNPIRDEVRFEGKVSRYILADVTLTKTETGWDLNSTKQTALRISNLDLSTFDPSSAGFTTEQVSGMKVGLQNMMNQAGAGLGTDGSVSGWLVIDKLSADFQGNGVDAVVGAEAFAFSDLWMPLASDIWYNKVGGVVISAGVHGTSGADSVGVGMGAGVTYDFSGSDWFDAGEGDDTVTAGAGGDNIRGGAGNDKVYGGANGVDSNGNPQVDSAQYSGDYDQYVITTGSDDEGSWISVQDNSGSDGTDRLYGVEALSFRDRWVRMTTDANYWTDATGKAVGSWVNGSMLKDRIDASALNGTGIYADLPVSGDKFTKAGSPTYSDLQHNINGNEGDDTIIGGNGPDWITGGAGDDQIIGGTNGLDQNGNPGNDVAQYDGKFARYTVTVNTSGDFTLNGSTVTATGSKPVIQVVDSVLVEEGGLGSDLLYEIEALSFWDRWMPVVATRNYNDFNRDGTPDEVFIRGTASAETIAPETISGGAQISMRVEAGDGNDTITGGSKKDWITGGAGNDSIDGGGDVDVAIYSVNYDASKISSPSAGTFVLTLDGTDTLTNIEGVQFKDRYVSLSVSSETTATLKRWQGTLTGDNITGDASLANFINGDAGNDTLTGGAQNDMLVGGAGSDTLDGGVGDNDRAQFTGNSADYTFAMPLTAADEITVTHNGGGVDGVDKLRNIEALVFKDKVVKVVPQGQVAVVTSIELDTNGDGVKDQKIWTGTTAADVITGASNMTNVIDGDTQNDTITGGNWGDVLRGGAGNDTIDGGANENVDGVGNQALDTALYSSARASYTIVVSLADVFVPVYTVTDTRTSAPEGVDTLTGIERLVFSDRAVSLKPQITTVGEMTVTGLAKVNKVQGTEFADALFSTTAIEYFDGGAGVDQFIFQDGSGADVIRNFVAGDAGDVIKLWLPVGDTDGINGSTIDTDAELKNAAVSQGTDTLIALGGGNTILLVGVAVDSLTLANFAVINHA